ncbi:unnamed protein product [Bemisia tabaci]|uniref:Uncharacterized protein n=1 Tax=Bemisia tabaci TaxID=7038 RepID=A0A9P0AIM3_BEMTA|nr:unnamed protein product [Bemisia tabaci]
MKLCALFLLFTVAVSWVLADPRPQDTEDEISYSLCRHQTCIKMRLLFTVTFGLIIVISLVSGEKEQKHQGVSLPRMIRPCFRGSGPNIELCEECINSCQSVGNELEYCEAKRCRRLCRGEASLICQN